jgi:coproporphyrinogen III oxidase
MRQVAADFFKQIQSTITTSLEELDSKEKFRSDIWTRTDLTGSPGGGGETRILRSGKVFEQAGVNFSSVHGAMPEELSEKISGQRVSAPFYATGISLVLHPFSPMIPTTHANFRYLEVGDKAWFGGGMDLTPYYVFEEDAKHFHSTIKHACDPHDLSYYHRFKQECDKYFFLPHRNEHRGVGGIFFDYLGKDSPKEDLSRIFLFVQDIAKAFLPAYIPIVQRRANEAFSSDQKNFQLIRRGRYVEFNLLYDRGTLFGLKTGGRIESILMSLPPNVCWEYDFKPTLGSKEAHTIEVLKNARNWL